MTATKAKIIEIKERAKVLVSPFNILCTASGIKSNTITAKITIAILVDIVDGLKSE
ncbi:MULTISPECIES: hypothetical protein [Bacteroides]|uniref:hypothetical protein n=1 Tax=Bacteroides TaxID=816 RepID=UPI00155AA74F|nr:MULTISPECIES: hypothetical protein [Bacteroides]HJD91472.1 hypothetical protein [Bacteroides coprosuis]